MLGILLQVRGYKGIWGVCNITFVIFSGISLVGAFHAPSDHVLFPKHPRLLDMRQESLVSTGLNSFLCFDIMGLVCGGSIHFLI